jgi:hypothetical protein
LSASETRVVAAMAAAAPGFAFGSTPGYDCGHGALGYTRPVTPAAHDHPLRRALPRFLFAGLCLTSLDATAKYLVRDHAAFLIVWARCAGQTLLVTPWAWHRAGRGFWRTRHLRLQLVCSAFLLLLALRERRRVRSA